MKKILYITTISGFLPQFEKNDVRIMREMGYEIHYASNFKNPIYTFNEKELKQQGIVLHQIDISKNPAQIIKNCRAIRQLKKIIDEENITVIHCHNPMGGVAARIAAHYSKANPFVMYTAHGLHFYKGAPLLNWLLFYPTEKLLARWTDTLITINKEDYCCVKDRFKLKKNGTVEQIHGVGIDLDKFRPMPELAAPKRRKLGIPNDAFHIVTAAELNKNKNQKIIIEAIASENKSDIYYTICGSGPSEDELRKIIHKKHLEKQVQLLGFRTDMNEILQTADVFAFPSVREGLGIAAVEALACGVPLIVADNRGTREYIHSDKNGLVCNAFDQDAFVAAIDKMYTNVEYRKKLANHCRRSAIQFGTEETAKTMKRVYEDMDKRLS